MSYSKTNKKELLEKLENIIKGIILDYTKSNSLTDIRFYDLKFIRGKEVKLQLFLDGKNVNLDICADINSIVSEALDSEDLVKYDNYILEVSSAGLDRRLKSIAEAESFIGQLCLIVLLEHLDGDLSQRKRFLGKLKKVTDDSVSIFVTKENKEFVIDRDKINYIKLEIDF